MKWLAFFIRMQLVISHLPLEDSREITLLELKKLKDYCFDFYYSLYVFFQSAHIFLCSPTPYEKIKCNTKINISEIVSGSKCTHVPRLVQITLNKPTYFSYHLHKFTNVNWQKCCQRLFRPHFYCLATKLNNVIYGDKIFFWFDSVLSISAFIIMSLESYCIILLFNMNIKPVEGLGK